MKKEYDPSAVHALTQAQEAMRSNRKRDAHYWASKAASLAPDWDAPWLILAAVSQPAASIHYLKKALEINPSSQKARQGMRWAIKRYRESAPPVAKPTGSP
jgi:hypothetical protein